MVNRKLSPLPTLTFILIVIIVLCVLWPGIVSYFALLIALVLSSIILLLHLILAWAKLTVTQRCRIVFSILAWLGLFYGLAHANGLSIASLFGCFLW